MLLQSKVLENRIYVYDKQDTESIEFMLEIFRHDGECEECAGNNMPNRGAYYISGNNVDIGICEIHLRRLYPVIFNESDIMQHAL